MFAAVLRLERLPLRTGRGSVNCPNKKVTCCRRQGMHVLRGHGSAGAQRGDAREGFRGGTSVSAQRAGAGRNGASPSGTVSTGQGVQEIGYDDDATSSCAAAIHLIDSVELVDAGTTTRVDVGKEQTVVSLQLWWRDWDGDLVDALVDALTPHCFGG